MEAQAQSLGQQLARMREENERLGLEQARKGGGGLLVVFIGAGVGVAAGQVAGKWQPAPT